MATQTLSRQWFATTEGGQWRVRINDSDTPQHSIHNVCGIAHTLEDDEAVAKAIAQTPNIVALLAKLTDNAEAAAILAAMK